MWTATRPPLSHGKRESDVLPWAMSGSKGGWPVEGHLAHVSHSHRCHSRGKPLKGQSRPDHPGVRELSLCSTPLTLSVPNGYTRTCSSREGGGSQRPSGPQGTPAKVGDTLGSLWGWGSLASSSEGQGRCETPCRAHDSPPPHKATSQKDNSGEAPGHGPEFLDSAWGGHGPVCRTESPAEPQAPQGQLVWWGTQRDPEKTAGGADNSRRRGQGPVAVRGPGGEVCRPRQRHPDESGGVRRRGRGNRGRPRALLGPLLSPGH